MLLGTADNDRSRYSVAEVREFLRILRVPLFVRSALPVKEESSASAWGGVEDASSVYALERAVRRLRKALARQRIVWVEGTHLPQEVTFANASVPIAFADAGGQGN